MSQHAEPAGRLYASLRLLARFWIWFLFREVAVRAAARVPATGPVLVCVNHPNNLIDSLLLAAVLSRKVHFLANASLFRNRLLGALLARAGAIPVHRRQDAPGAPDRTAATFAAARQALEDGRVLAIYPEGTTHAESRVQRIKTGAARIALDYETWAADPRVRPARPARPRSRRAVLRDPQGIPRPRAGRLRRAGPARAPRGAGARGADRGRPEPDRRHPARHGGGGRPRRSDRRWPRSSAPSRTCTARSWSVSSMPSAASGQKQSTSSGSPAPSSRRSPTSRSATRTASPRSGSGSSTTARCSPRGTCGIRQWARGCAGTALPTACGRRPRRCSGCRYFSTGASSTPCPI